MPNGFIQEHLSYEDAEGSFRRYDIYDQLTYLLDELGRISQCGAEIQNVNYCPKPRLESGIFNTDINIFLVSQSLGVYVPHIPSAPIIDRRVIHEACYRINEELATILNRCAPFSETWITPRLVQSHIYNLWEVLDTEGVMRRGTLDKKCGIISST